ncbi:MAG TPA: glycoside hydrolase family 20 zincin-like fold domain-containing protein [Candidatus Kapabacteria bacterium]|nr:glycoside hydrolase family 20 zincin-like fold domain-containing protein [Candidatus Kapabacteria bacterium]
MNRRTLILLAILAAASSRMRAQGLVEGLMPHPKTAFTRTETFAIHPETPIVVPDDADSTTMHAARFLQQGIRIRSTGNCPIVPVSQWDTAGAPAIVLGTFANAFVAARAARALPKGAEMPGRGSAEPGGYALDVRSGQVLVAGNDPDGVFNGAAALLQLTTPGNLALFVQGAFVWDYPDYPVRWVFSQHNLRGANAMQQLGTLLDTMAAYRLNGIQQGDFKYNLLEQQPQYYFDSVSRFKAMAAAANAEIIPGTADIGYSEGILWHDPNLAEGFAASAPYVIEADTGRILPDARVALPNGGFENVDGNGKFTGWSFYDDGAVTADNTTAHGGARSARCTNFTNGNPSGNCRFNRRMSCNPHRTYVMSAWLKTSGLSADAVQLLALGVDGKGNTQALTFTQFNVPATTSGWVRTEVVFNTLEESTVLLYAGVWGGRSGTIWWDDFDIRDAGLTNVLHRPGTPLHIRSSNGATEYHEGTDVAPIADPLVAGSNGSYGPYHSPPTLRRTPGGAIHNGDTVILSWFHPVTTISDERGNGQVMICPSEDTLYSILRTQMNGIAGLYAPHRFMFGHDEIRAMNQDSACQARGIGPANLLADNVRRCIAIAGAAQQGAGCVLWSDMFDKFHNAHAGYYLVNGDLSGVWDSIPHTALIANWNFGSRDSSLGWFDRMGFRQIACPYYDEHDTRNIRAWRLSLQGLQGAQGMMYTTWSGDYGFLKPFAYYAWGAGPYVIHEPPDTAALPARNAGGGSLCFSAEVLPDPYDPSDSITAVTLSGTRYSLDGTPHAFTAVLHRDSGNVFTGCVDSLTAHGLRYTVRAANRQGLDRITAQYLLERADVAGIPDESPARSVLALRAVPNPAATALTLSFTMPAHGTWSLTVSDLLGRMVGRTEGDAEAGPAEPTFDVAALRPGNYECTLRAAGRTETVMLRVVR